MGDSPKFGFAEKSDQLQACQACHADFLPFPLKAEDVSQPVSAWKTGRACDFSSPNVLQIALMLRNR